MEQTEPSQDEEDGVNYDDICSSCRRLRDQKMRAFPYSVAVMTVLLVVMAWLGTPMPGLGIHLFSSCMIGVVAVWIGRAEYRNLPSYIWHACSINRIRYREAHGVPRPANMTCSTR